MNRIFTVLVFFFSLTYNAYTSSDIQRIIIERTGGGAISIIVSEDEMNEFFAYVVSCGNKELDSIVAEQTKFKITNQDHIKAIFLEKAEIYPYESDPEVLKGTWLSIELIKNKVSTWINDPVVKIEGIESKIINDIEKQARESAKYFCK